MTFDFLLETYDTERLKTLSAWSVFTDQDMEFRPAQRIRTPREHMVHQCVSEDAWMKNMFGVDTGKPALPQQETRLEFIRHYAELSQLRLAALIWLLLAQRVQTRQRFRARHVAVNDDIVAFAVRRKKTVDAMSGE